MEMARISQEQAEKVALAAQIVKEWVEEWTDEDLAKMKATREAVETDLAYSTTIIPLSEFHSASERRKAFKKARIEKAWGNDWEEKLGEMLPPWLAEEFLRELARFAERNKTWVEAKVLMESNIAQRLAAKSTKKYKWLTARDIAEKATVEKTRLRGKKVTNKQSPAGQEASKTPSPQPEQSDLAEIPEESEAGQGTESSPSSNFSDPQPLQNRLAEAEPSTPKGAREVETSGRKRRRQSEGGKRKRYRIDIPVIDLDVEEGVDELKREAEGEEEKDDALAVEGALRILTAGDGKQDAGILKRRLEKLLKASKAEIEEELDN